MRINFNIILSFCPGIEHSLIRSWHRAQAYRNSVSVSARQFIASIQKDSDNF